MALCLDGRCNVLVDYPIVRHAKNMESVMAREGTDEFHALVPGNVITVFYQPRLALAVPEGRIVERLGK